MEQLRSKLLLAIENCNNYELQWNDVLQMQAVYHQSSEHIKEEHLHQDEVAVLVSILHVVRCGRTSAVVDATNEQKTN